MPRQRMVHPALSIASPPIEGRVVVYAEGSGNTPTIVGFADVLWVSEPDSFLMRPVHIKARRVSHRPPGATPASTLDLIAADAQTYGSGPDRPYVVLVDATYAPHVAELALTHFGYGCGLDGAQLWPIRLVMGAANPLQPPSGPTGIPCGVSWLSSFFSSELARQGEARPYKGGWVKPDRGVALRFNEYEGATGDLTVEDLKTAASMAETLVITKAAGREDDVLLLTAPERLAATLMELLLAPYLAAPSAHRGPLRRNLRGIC